MDLLILSLGFHKLTNYTDICIQRSLTRTSVKSTEILACEQAHLWVTHASDPRAKRSGGEVSGVEALSCVFTTRVTRLRRSHV